MEEIRNHEQLLTEAQEIEKEQEKNDNIIKMKITQYTTQIEIAKQKIKEMQKIEKEVQLYKLYISAMRAIPLMLINKAKPILESQINNMLKPLTDFSVKIEVGEKNIDLYLVREEYNGRNILLSNASGFEKFVSSLCIRVALLQISNLPKPNFIAIDEGWSSFDYSNINNIGIIFDYLKSKFEFVLTISHKQEIRQHINYQILLKRDENKLSYVVN